MKLVLILMQLSGIAFANNSMWAPTGTANITATPARILAADSLRSYLIIVNTGSNMVFVNSVAETLSSPGIPIPPGGNYEPLAASAGEVWISTASSTSTVTYMIGH